MYEKKSNIKSRSKEDIFIRFISYFSIISSYREERTYIDNIKSFSNFPSCKNYSENVHN